MLLVCMCACLFNLILLLDGMDRMEASFTLFVMYILILTRELLWNPSRFGLLEGESGPSKQLLQIDPKSMRLIPNNRSRNIHTSKVSVQQSPMC